MVNFRSFSGIWLINQMDESRITTIEPVEPFLAGNSDIKFLKYDSDEERYAHISRVLKRFTYTKTSKAHRGVLLR